MASSIRYPRNPNQPFREPVGHTYHPPKKCHDCETMVPDSKGMERGGVKRCGPCDIRFCSDR